MADEVIDIRRPGDRMLICGTCGMKRTVPPAWRAVMRASMPPGEAEAWDGVVHCRNGHPAAPMHGFDGMEHEHEPVPRWRGRCACGHADEWGTDKDAAWEALAAHLAVPLRAALVTAGKPVITRMICDHQQFSAKPCPHGCHDRQVQLGPRGWTPGGGT